MTAIIPDVFCQVTLTVNADTGRKLMGKHVRKCGAPAVSPYGLCRQHQADRERLMTPSAGVGTDAGEGAPRQDTGSAWVTRSADCPEAPAQAHPRALTPSQRPPNPDQ